MNNIDQILNNYFEGNSLPDEEKRLREYFRSNDVMPQHEEYKPLFAAFEKEKQIVAPTFMIPSERSNRKQHAIRNSWIAAAGMAAMILLLFTVKPFGDNNSAEDDYLVFINGKAVKNPEKAQEYADRMFMQANEIIRSSCEPFVEANMMQQEMDPDKIFDNLSQNIDDIESLNQ